ncbi:BspA family leucine-rich repeat surface protein [Schleiferilactobacillus harbinensis]|jgi:surface protein|uniref:BspA family leucine-rich repeat surface protein n=1 Tax=Schleiferilactobacillus harbinensis TaxID=304207 RepID=UPI0024317598|nr:BspA family leucine-rich repeat surface protein [Schleiferilactobacillus harbinensis]MCI1687197.1 BspA family leucine-rich repeat surface protein [Schleiferilactobacillus harbinensis]MCI1783487.1 BspA family leucine-rich repeat surface protein [Schleiferilactobacillus harbinensis]MCI1849976.1 BspA family leucine-rich repeat surface protein [Schleiferilactobacillus harbinensis]
MKQLVTKLIRLWLEAALLFVMSSLLGSPVYATGNRASLAPGLSAQAPTNNPPPFSATVMGLISATTVQASPPPAVNDVSWWTVSGGTLTIDSTHVLNAATDAPGNVWPWASQASTIKQVIIQPNTRAVGSLKSLFNGLDQVTTIQGLDTLDTSQVTNMSQMFFACRALNNVDVSALDTRQVTDMSLMFEYCDSLTNLKLGGKFDTSHVKTMYAMFIGCPFTSFDATQLNTSNVQSMGLMFENCNGLTTLDLSSFDTSKVTNMNGMFLGCSKLTTLNISTFKTGLVTDMSMMFYNCPALTKLDVRNFDTHSVNSMSYMFASCGSLTSLDLSHFDTSAVSDMSYMFQNSNHLTALDLSTFQTPQVTSMNAMFNGCSGLKSLNVSGWSNAKVTTMYQMFNGCSSLTTLNLTNFATSAVTNMGYMFWGCNSLPVLDVSAFDTSNVTNMGGMFGGCKQVRALDVSHFNTSRVTDTSQMFLACAALTQLDLHTFDTRKVTDMYDMMRDCTSLIQANVAGFNTSAVTRISGFFMNDRKLLTADLSSFDVRTLSNHDVGDMFANCTSLWKISVGDKAQLGQGNNGNLPPHSAGAIAQNSPDPYTAGAGWQEIGTAANPLEANGPQFSASGNSATPGTLMYLLSQPRAGTVNPATGKAVWTYVWQPQRWWNITGDTLNIGTQPHTLNFTNDKYSTNNSWPWSSQTDVAGVKHIKLAATGLSAQGSISGLFKGLSSVTDIANLPNLDASKATDTSDMFSGCAALTSLDLSTLDTRQVTAETGMFAGTTHLWQLKLGPNFKTTADDLGLGGPITGTVITSNDAAGQAHSYTIQATDTAWQELGTMGTLLAPTGDTYTPADLIKLYHDGSRPTTIHTYVWQQTGAGTIGLTMTGSFDYGKHFQPVFSALTAQNMQPLTLTVTDSRADRVQMQWHVDVTGSDFVSTDDPSVQVSANPWRFNPDGTNPQPIAAPLTIWQNTSTSADAPYIKTWATNPFELDFTAGSVPQVGKYQATITFTLGNGLS